MVINFILGSLSLKDDLSLKILEGDLNVPVDLLLKPMPFPLPSKLEWLKDGRPLRQSDLITTTYSSVTFTSVMRTDAGNYTVNAMSFLLDGVTQPVGSDMGSFYLDVLCKLIVIVISKSTHVVSGNRLLAYHENLILIFR